MRLLDILNKSKFGSQAENQSFGSTYQQAILREYNVKFEPTIDSAQFDSYVKIELGSTFGAVLPVSIDYLVAENSSFLMTEDNNNLIT